MQCPVFFGVAEDLAAAGIRTEDAYPSLYELLEALLQAGKQSKKQVFENDSALDWLERYYMPEEPKEAERLKPLLQELRSYCGTDTNTYGAYEAVSKGTCLLGGCGTSNCMQMIENLSIFPEDQELAFVRVPDYSGEVSAVITHAVGIYAGGRPANGLDAAEHGAAYRRTPRYEESDGEGRRYAGKQQDTEGIGSVRLRPDA